MHKSNYKYLRDVVDHRKPSFSFATRFRWSVAASRELRIIVKSSVSMAMMPLEIISNFPYADASSFVRRFILLFSTIFILYRVNTLKSGVKFFRHVYRLDNIIGHDAVGYKFIADYYKNFHHTPPLNKIPRRGLGRRTASVRTQFTPVGGLQFVLNCDFGLSMFVCLDFLILR